MPAPTPQVVRIVNHQWVAERLINITMDGVNVQDNISKSSDGFFTYVRPRVDAVDEVTVSTGISGAESAGEGKRANQIRYPFGQQPVHGQLVRIST
ncbi:MAG: hypothetical protein U0X75_16650 [Acidobacteriota bacterium]